MTGTSLTIDLFRIFCRCQWAAVAVPRASLQRSALADRVISPSAAKWFGQEQDQSRRNAMAGIELIISSICNATFCEVPYNDTVKVDSPSITEQNHKNLAMEINGKIIKVGTFNNTPLSGIENRNGTLIGKGVAFIIMEILRRKFNFTVEVVEPKKNYEMGGMRPEDSLIGLVNASQVDVAAAFLPTLIPYRQLVSFSITLDEGIWMMMLKRPKESAAGSGLLAPFNEFVWYVVLASVLTFGPCITFFTRLRSKLVPDDEGVLPLDPSFWFVYSAFLKQGTSLSPEANTTRVLFVTWWLFMILLSAFYTANLTAFLTLSKFTLAIESPRDLYQKNQRWISPAGGSVEYTVKSEGDELQYLSSMINTKRAMFLLGNDNEYLDAVKKGAVLVREASVIDHMMYRDYLTKKDVEESEKCTYVVAPNPFMKKERAFAYPIGSKLKDLFDPVLTKIFQSGILSFLERYDLPSTKICPLDLQSKDRKLRNSDLVMTYMVMGAGTATAMAVFFAELILKRYDGIKIMKVRGTKGQNLKPKRQQMTPQDESPPPPYESLFGRKYNVNQSRKRMINGREYYEYVTTNGDRRLIPARAPSSLLYRSDK